MGHQDKKTFSLTHQRFPECFLPVSFLWLMHSFLLSCRDILKVSPPSHIFFCWILLLRSLFEFLNFTFVYFPQFLFFILFLLSCLAQFLSVSFHCAFINFLKYLLISSVRTSIKFIKTSLESVPYALVIMRYKGPDVVAQLGSYADILSYCLICYWS